MDNSERLAALERVRALLVRARKELEPLHLPQNLDLEARADISRALAKVHHAAAILRTPVRSRPVETLQPAFDARSC